MKVGDLVRLKRPGWEKIIGLAFESKGRNSDQRLAVLWSTTGKVEWHYVERLEVINESR